MPGRRHAGQAAAAALAFITRLPAQLEWRLDRLTAVTLNAGVYDHLILRSRRAGRF